MNPNLLFWVPALLRLGLMLIPAGVIGYLFGLVAALVAALLALLVVLFVQLQYLYRLSHWLDRPNSQQVPDGWGAWREAFSRLYRLRREDERNQRELSEWLARFRQAMQLLPEGVAIMDDVLFLEWCNEATERHLGLSLARDQGLRITNLVRQPEFIDYIILGRYEQPLTLSFKGRKLECRIIPFENRRQILVTHDATDSERMAAMRRDFIANASHELRTPLTVIVGFLEIALNAEALDDETRRAHLLLMNEQAARMQGLIEDMLILSRLESDDVLLRRTPVDMRALLESVAQEARALSGGRHQIEIEVTAPDIMGNGDELRSAIANLASNAVRYSPDGGVIRLAWVVEADRLALIVSDQGIGIEAQHLPRLTERFYRVDKSRSRDAHGTGLGLAIVKHVMLRHGGQLRITSTPGQGSTFTALLPATSLPTSH